MSSVAARLLLPVAALVAIVTVTVGVWVHQTTGKLGTATPPLVIDYAPDIAWPWAALAAVTAAGAAWAAPRLATGRRLGGRLAWPAAVTLLALVPGLMLGASRNGSLGWREVFLLGPGGSFEAKNEYLAGLPALSYGPRVFLDRFAELVPSLPVNVAGHPPALMLVIDALGLTTAGRLAALCIAGAVALPALTLLLGRAVGLPEAPARVAAVLAALSPMVLLFGITSGDAVFAAVGTVAAILLVTRSRAARAAGCVALALAAFFSWALLAIAAWAAVVVLVRDGWRRALALAVGCGLAVLALNAVLAAAFGYDPIGSLRATEVYYRNSVATRRPYWFYLVGSPVAFAVSLGAPIALAALAAVRRRAPAAVGLAVIIGVASVAGFTKAETERIWLPFVPLACVAAAEVLGAARLRWVAPLLAVQSLVVVLLFQTIW